MTDSDYLYCLANMQLDDEAYMKRHYCESCRDKGVERKCLRCSRPLFSEPTEVNPNFDNERFEQLKRGDYDGGQEC
jgi:hypothetical protein